MKPGMYRTSTPFNIDGVIWEKNSVVKVLRTHEDVSMITVYMTKDDGKESKGFFYIRNYMTFFTLINTTNYKRRDRVLTRKIPTKQRTS